MKAQEHKDYIRPGRVFGNLWFVGLRSASTHIIDTGEGLILIDPGFGETLWIVRENIRELGFDEKDIRIILMTHGHYDHAGATAELVRLTGAKTCIGKEDLAMVTGREDSSLAELFGVTFTDFFTPDVLLSDGDHVTLGNTDILRFEDGDKTGTAVEVEAKKTGTTTVTANNLHTGGKIVYTVKVVPDYDD